MRNRLWGTGALLGLFALPWLTVPAALAETSQMTPRETPRPAPRPRPDPVRRPDLVLEPLLHDQTGEFGFCIKEGTKLFARAVLFNRGRASVPTTVLFIRSKVEFSNGQTLTLNGPPKLFPYFLEWEIPAACFQADCSFKITADYDDQVKESNESNNVVLGRCPPG